MKLLIHFIFLISLTLASDVSEDTAKITYLLDKIESSGAIFIRNGDEHPAKKAREHLEHKLKMAKRMFWFFGPEKEVSVDDFINKIASKSSTTDKEYHVRLKDGRTVKTEKWLKELLEKYP